jgi:hypothetical protein
MFIGVVALSDNRQFTHVHSAALKLLDRLIRFSMGAKHRYRRILYGHITISSGACRLSGIDKLNPARIWQRANTKTVQFWTGSETPLNEYVRYDHDDRAHLALAKGTPAGREVEKNTLIELTAEFSSIVRVVRWPEKEHS